jgi:hypothetical protein
MGLMAALMPLPWTNLMAALAALPGFCINNALDFMYGVSVILSDFMSTKPAGRQLQLYCLLPWHASWAAGALNDAP